jgi:electron transport complex protein RnfC
VDHGVAGRFAASAVPGGSTRERTLRAKTFPGGVHPPTTKELTKRAEITEARLPARVVIPLRQALGAPAEPCVRVGDEVRTGQKIGEASGFVSVPVHASITGKVAAIGRFPHPLGSEQAAIVIEGEGDEAWDDSVVAHADPQGLAPDEIKNMIRDAGIVGLGGAAFPTHVKLSPPESKPIDAAILNGAECEPWLTADHRLMVERPSEILGGFLLIMRALGCERGVVGIEQNKPDALEAMRAAAKSAAGVTVHALQVKYPQGAEKHLIDAVLGRHVPAGGLPMDVGVVVQNVGTSLAVHEACYLGRPLIERVMTLTGTPVSRPTNFLVRLGTLVSDLLNEAGGLAGDVAKVISGGPMMGIAQFTLDVPVIKGMSGVLFLAPGEMDIQPPEPCLRCGRCVDVCPMRLVPTTIEKLVVADHIEEATEVGLLDCMECGSCAYVCPSKRRLVHYFKFGKQTATERRKAAAKKSEKGSQH